MVIRLRFEIREPIPSLFLTFFLQNMDGVQVVFSDVRDTDPEVAERLRVGLHTFEIKIPSRLLAPTTYSLTVSSYIRFTGVVDQRDACCEYVLRELTAMRTGHVGRSSILSLFLPWEHERSDPGSVNDSAGSQFSLPSRT